MKDGKYNTHIVVDLSLRSVASTNSEEEVDVLEVLNDIVEGTDEGPPAALLFVPFQAYLLFEFVAAAGTGLLA